MKKVYLLCVALFPFVAFSQDEIVQKLKNDAEKKVKVEADTTNWKWKSGGVINMNLSQASLKNWAGVTDFFLHKRCT